MDQTTRQHLIAYAEGNPPGAQIECDLGRLIDEFIEEQCDPNTTAGIEALMRENASVAREIAHQTEESRCLGMVLDRQVAALWNSLERRSSPELSGRSLCPAFKEASARRIWLSFGAD